MSDPMATDICIQYLPMREEDASKGCSKQWFLNLTCVRITLRGYKMPHGVKIRYLYFQQAPQVSLMDTEVSTASL